MNTINASLISIIESAVKESLKNFEARREDISLNDLYFNFNAENGILYIYDDMENCLLDVNLEKEQEDNPEVFESQLIQTARKVLQSLAQEGCFNKEFIFKPFSVSMVDEDFIVSDELLFIDDDTMKLDGDLLSELDKDLDDFLKNLLKN